jgi:ABC-type multidrug transport system fused ATPase/permease subunit
MVNVLIAILATIYTAIAIPFLGLAFWLVCRTYLRISYQVRLLDLNSVSPIFNHAIETMQGYHTIHSFGWQDYFYSKFLCLLDESQRPYYTMFAVQQLLQVVLDLFVAVLAIIACSATVAFKNAVDPGILGLTLTSLVRLTPHT